jgi:hypothetical protein
VLLPAVKNISNGRLIGRLSGKVLKNSTASKSWLCRPLVGSGWPGR